MDGVRQSIESNGHAGPGRVRSNTAGTVGTVGSVGTGSSKSGEREMQKVLAAGEKEQVEAEEVKEKVVPKLRLTADDLSKYGKWSEVRLCLGTPLTSF
jgi:hypothetical protein